MFLPVYLCVFFFYLRVWLSVHYVSIWVGVYILDYELEFRVLVFWCFCLFIHVHFLSGYQFIMYPFRRGFIFLDYGQEFRVLGSCLIF